uniref:DNA topoisomerase (ATP-hydrolyzing) n=1 Tax=viral metagenome TaxID=1070528 RepID=A0A6C0ADR2_9ZZZZ
MEKYVKLNPREHVLLKPSMYLGDTSIRDEENYVFEDDKIIKKKVNWSPALYKIFDEIIVNAYDQTIRDQTLSFIKVTINPKYIEVENDGEGIDIYIHPKHKVYIPELIFGNLMTSTNFSQDEERITGGTHGLGAKLTNIFSKVFEIEVKDKKRGLYYTQTFRDNLTIIEKPKIEKYDGKTGGFKVRFYPDFERFKLKELDEDHIKLFTKRVYDLCGLTNKTIYLNKKKIDIKSWEQYLTLYDKDLKVYSCNKHWKLGFKVEPNAYQVSFVNGIFTNKNGRHVDSIFDQILDKYSKRLKDVTKRWLKNSITLVLKTSIINPSFNSQTKEELMTPTSKFGITCELDSKFFNMIDFKTLEDLFRKQSKILFGKIEGTKKSKIKGIPKLEDANFAGTKKSVDCTLILTEGDSAKATAISGVSAVKNGRDIYGVFPLRGKLINVREASIKQINNNEEITNLKKIMGFKSGVKYTKDNIHTLRYGSIMLMMDADEDGSHIKGLVINFLNYFYPSLLKLDGFLKVLITPVVKATYKDQTLTFRNQSDYLVWRQNNDTEKYKIKYYKGLGTSTRQEAGEYFKQITDNMQFIEAEYLKIPHPQLELAFGRKFAEQRKEWLRKYDIEERLKFEPGMTTSIKDFINLEMKHFSNYDNIRSLPNLVDGLKPAQRKVIYACLKRNLESEMKVAQLSGYVAEVTSYHHGENSLVQTIINLAQDFVGSNNLNLLKPNGQFGCIDPETPVLLWNGDIKKAKNIKVGDKLIGDDGTSRKVEKITEGFDNMYKITNGDMDDYIVNSYHILTVHYSGHKYIFWEESTKSWKMNYFDDLTKTVKCKSVETRYMTKDVALNKMKEFADTIQDENRFDLNVQQYLNLPNSIKKNIKGIVNSSCIEWESQKLNIDPYILGYWLGNTNNDCNLESLNPFEELLKKHNLFKNKHIPKKFIFNSKENRLKLLAGFIDINGSLSKQDDNYKYKIFQSQDKKDLIESLRIISGSLGFKSKVCEIKENMLELSISGNIAQIPTKVTSKQIQKNSYQQLINPFIQDIKVEYLRKGKFCGWNIDKNERFLLGDFTITHNTRLLSGKDASSARYIFTQLNPITKYIFRKEDDGVLEYQEDDGFKIEPKVYYPILPTLLINGSEGIGTGFSTIVHNYSVNDLIEVVEDMLDNKPIKKINPSFKNFKGKIEKVDKYTYITKGVYEIKDNTLIIKELPIKVWTTNYKIFLEDLLYEKNDPFFSSLSNQSSDQEVLFILKIRDMDKVMKMATTPYKKGVSLLEKHLKLYYYLGIGNMHMFNNDLDIIRYDNVEQILKEYYKIRIQKYQERKDYILKVLKEELQINNNKMAWIKDILDNKIDLRKQSADELVEYLKKKRVTLKDKSYNYLLNTTIKEMSKDNVTKLKSKIDNLKKEIEILTKKTPEQLWKADLEDLKNALRKYN